ncbi:hypothetical protein VR41_10055 [Streptomyces sp. NRRL B-1568]|nr:hypothetical protein VR41_10055 [Streptomyces sp. NRRL B-1568]
MCADCGRKFSDDRYAYVEAHRGTWDDDLTLCSACQDAKKDAKREAERETWQPGPPRPRWSPSPARSRSGRSAGWAAWAAGSRGKAREPALLPGPCPGPVLVVDVMTADVSALLAEYEARTWEPTHRERAFAEDLARGQTSSTWLRAGLREAPPGRLADVLVPVAAVLEREPALPEDLVLAVRRLLDAVAPLP